MLKMIQSKSFAAKLFWRDRRVVAGALILALGLLIVAAGREGLSNFYVQSARQEVERWSAPGQVLRGDEGTRVNEYLARSLAFSPSNPWALEEAGTLLLRGMNAMRDPQLADAVARAANGNFRAALAQRPTSPFSWANFALTKLYLGERDDALIRSIENAETLGPWEPEVQQTVVFAGLALWDRLGPAQQAAVQRAMGRGAQRNPGKILDIVKSFNRIDLYCAFSYSPAHSREICSTISKAGKRP